MLVKRDIIDKLLVIGDVDKLQVPVTVVNVAAPSNDDKTRTVAVISATVTTTTHYRTTQPSIPLFNSVNKTAVTP
jgi:hypothetical protein